jgi:nucleoside-diphosphate-sugar epimerase
MRILVAGSEGMIGSNVVRLLRERGESPDLCDKKSGWDARDVRDFYDIIYDCASPTRGIGSHDFLETAQIPLNLVQQTAHIVYLSSSCVYPDNATIPTPESEGFLGEPEEANRGYGWAKRAGELACRYSNAKYTILRLGNIYGPSYDWTNPVKHVIPSLIERILSGENPLVVWGSGNQTRSFMYEESCARIILEMSDRAGNRGVFNAGGQETSIHELVETIAEIVGYEGKIVFDTTKPEGPLRKAQDTNKMDSIVRAHLSLHTGLERTISAARRNYRVSESALRA